MAELFDCSSNNIAAHLKNIYAEKELDEIPTTQVFWVVQKEGNRKVNRSIKHYSKQDAEYVSDFDEETKKYRS